MNAFQLWMVGLFVAGSLVALCIAALCVLLWQRRPKQEPTVETRVKERLIELADPAHVPHRKTA